MNSDDLRNRVHTAILETFEIEPSSTQAEFSVETVEKWDSLGHLALMRKLEAEFSIEIDHADAVEMLSEAEIVARLKSSS